MKNLFITIVAVAMSVSLYSQSVYTLNGKLGIGKLPEEKLDVDGNAIIRGDLFVLGNSSVQAGSVVGQNLYLPNLTPISAGDIIVRDGEGKIRVINPKSFHSMIQPTHADCASGFDSYWKYEPGKIYSRCIDGTDVGIGTSSPQYRLDVVGDMGISTDLTIGESIVAADNNFQVSDQGEVFCRKLTISLDAFPFPDYVFEKDYKLMSLYDLEQYIERNKHLPNMPSSTDVAKNGGDIGEINRVLVEKVEELTLHTIAQQKLVDSQQQQINALIERINALDGEKEAKLETQRVNGK